MKLHCLNSKIDHEGRYASELDKDYEVPSLMAVGISEAWYSYAYGSYEGTGHMIARNTEGKWGYFYLGHCSCYGPTEYLDAKEFTSNSLEELVSRMSDELRAQVAHLIEEAK